MLPYAELHCVSNFSFLRGASHPEELVARAHELGYAALALTDECSVAGAVRAHQEAKRVGLPLLVGSEFRLEDDFPGARLVLIAQTRAGYGNLCELITAARMRAPKGRYRLDAHDLRAGLPDCLALWVPDPGAAADAVGAQARWLRDRFHDRAWLAAELLLRGQDADQLERLRAASGQAGVPLVAAGDVHFHVRSRKSLQDVLAATREGLPLADMGVRLSPNAEQHLRGRLRLARLYPPDLLEQTLEVASRCRFSLDELRYEYPEEIVPAGRTPAQWLEELTMAGALLRYPAGVPEAVAAQLRHELALIADLRYEPYFLTVADIVGWARARGILCQGRGSAANSAVCYCLGITEVDPARMSVLFERFISRERNEPPDIDVDFEHQRREEVIQYVYRKYGRQRAALAATVISYRARSAARDVGRALGIDVQRIDRLTASHQWWDGRAVAPERLREAGFDPDAPVVQHWTAMAAVLSGFPRHLSQHVGGFVIARDKLTRLVPVENAAMADRSVIQWDKDDLDALGLLKVDLLALGMLSAIRRALAFVGQRRGLPGPMRLQDIPAEDALVYEMISRADTVGVFQIESRAQMAMLPRLAPRSFYDLVIEVAIVRPGPIQGGMVHPYLRRRQGLERVEYPRDEIRPALERTLGVPIFQEQVMQIAILAAGFTPGEADQLRRAMAAWKRKGGLDAFRARVVDGMLARGYDRDFAESIFRQIEGFGEYGFPESHAASFALLVYVSCWLKCREPAAFLAGLLDSQPMGFYAPAQLVRDARAHGVEVRAPDVVASDVACTFEPPSPGQGPPAADADPILFPPDQPAVRLGLGQVRGLSAEGARRVVQARAQAPFADAADLARRARLEARDLAALAAAGALASLAGHRRQARWQVAGLAGLAAARRQAPLVADAHDGVRPSDVAPPLAPATEGEEIVDDYAALGLSIGRHPLALLRGALAGFGVQPAAVLSDYPHGRPARASGLVTHRQRPETARGTLFVTLEDETGAVNVIVWPRLLERFRAELLGARLMTVYGVWQRDDETGGRVAHLLAKRVVDHTPLLGRLVPRGRASLGRSRDFR
jgi:error-prone DNA polymerase